MTGETISGYRPTENTLASSERRVDLDRMDEGGALMAGAIEAFANKQIGLPEARKMVAEAAGMLL